MQKIEEFLEAIGLTYVETIADRRDTLVLRVLRSGKKMVLKFHDKSSVDKGQLLIQEAEILSTVPHLTNQLYVAHGTSQGVNWLLIREIEVNHIEGKNEIDLLRKVSGFYDLLYQGGYLHGDVQPAHTFLERDQITVIDWGMARKINESNPLYKGGFIYFVAPEIARSMKSGDSIIDYTTHAEVYALGATLFMFYTGSLAIDFGASKEKLKEVSMEQKLKCAIGNRILTFKEVGADPFPELEAILRKSLSTDPMKRFESPSELHQHLLKL